MTLPEICIRRPVFTTMLVLLPVVLGLFSLMRMGVDLFPNVDFPLVVVTTNRPGASVEEMETGVTKVIEEAINTIAGIDVLQSTTKEGTSTVVVEFVLEKDRDVAFQEVQSKVNTVLARLPTGTEAPILDKFDFNSIPVMVIAVSGKRSMREVTEIADRTVRDSLSSLSGVGTVDLIGGRKRAIHVTIDAAKLESYNLSIEQVRLALAEQNIELPGGRVDQNSRELVLRTMGRVQTPAQFRDIIVANVGGQPVRISDLGDPKDVVIDGFEEPRSLARVDGNNAVFLVVQKQSGANTVAVIDLVKKRLNLLSEGFTQEGLTDIRMDVVRDQSLFINNTLHEVEKHLILGAILVSLTILLFLRDWRTMVIASLSIPTSLMGSFVAMHALGFTINNITMLAMVLAVGIVIDDAVVVHENIFRWMEEKGLSAWDAAVGATQEIGLAVMATTFSLVVIFLPIAFMSGIVGRFFFAFGITIAIAILASMLVSFTLTPMLCSRFLRLSDKTRDEIKHGRSHHSGGVYGFIAERPYLWMLRWSMRHRWAVVLATFVVSMSLFPLPVGRWMSFGNESAANALRFLNYPGLIGLIGFDFIPKDDQSEFEIVITTPEGWSLDRVDRTVTEIEQKLRQFPEVTMLVTNLGESGGRQARGQGDVTKASIYVKLKELEDRVFSYRRATMDLIGIALQQPAMLVRWSDWWAQAKSRQKAEPGSKNFTQFDIMAKGRELMADYPDLRVSVQITQLVSGGGFISADVEFAITGPDINRLTEYAEQLMNRLRTTPGFTDVDTTLALRKPEVRVNIDRDRASDLGVSIQAIGSTLSFLVGGQIVSDYKDEQLGEQYDVWLRARGIDRDSRTTIADLTVPATKTQSGLARVANVATLVEARGPSQIDRLARQRKVSVIANLDGMPGNVAGEKFQQFFRELNAPPSYQLVGLGDQKTQNESYAAFFIAFLFSILFMYMILAAQFESFIHPVTILLAVPLTIPFAILSLIILQQPLTIYSVLGLFLLFGIVKKNGILQVDYSNVLRRQAAENINVVPALYRHGDASQRDPLGGNTGWNRWVSKVKNPAKRVRLWAIMESNRVRLRPILMTTLMLIAGMIPIALGEGPGAGSRASMAKVIVGGQALSLILSLLVVPVAYSLFDDMAIVFRRVIARLRGQSFKSPTPEPDPQAATL